MTNSETYSFLSKYTPSGSQTLSKMPSRFIRGVYPEVLDRGLGAHVWDAEGKEYIDLIAGLGCVSVGYVDADINGVVMYQLLQGVTFSLPHSLEGEVAKRLTELVPNTDMWKFGKNGTDATVMAVRAARAFTGRNTILTVGYNGCADVFECRGVRTAGIPSSLASDTYKAVYNDIKSFELLNYRDIACVLMEPMVYEYPKEGFLEAIRDLCTKTGTLLIFDEVVTGGRFAGFTAQSYFKVVPDITCLGKAIANGFPLSAVGGPRRIMSTFERDDFFASGTFGGETVSLAACLATVSKLETSLNLTIEQGAIIQKHFNQTFGTQLGGVCKGYPTRFIFEFPTATHKALFMQEMCLNGILIGHANMVMSNLSYEDVEKVLNAMDNTFRLMKQVWTHPIDAMKGPLPEDALRKS